MPALRDYLLRSSQEILDALSTATEPSASQISVKSELRSLLIIQDEKSDDDATINFVLACALLSSSQSSTNPLLSWIPSALAHSASMSFGELSTKICCSRDVNGEDIVPNECNVVVQLMPRMLHILKDRIKESSIDKSKDGDAAAAASARTPVGFAILAAHQFRWLVTQVDRESLKNMCTLVIPCGLTALDHWSPQVQMEGMISFVYMTKNVNAGDLTVYEDPLLDACCQSLVCADEIWPNAVEMSVFVVSLVQHSNPRSSWYEKMFNEMLNHLERHPRNKAHRISWLKFVDPLLHSLGLLLLAHFRRLFPLLFLWMHADDDETVLLVLQRTTTVIKLTWIRNTAYIERLVDELALLYKETALRIAREDIRKEISALMLLLKQGKFLHFERAWPKHADDSNLTPLRLTLSKDDVTSAHLE